MNKRYHGNLDLSQYGKGRMAPVRIKKTRLSLPKEPLQILRMLVSVDCGQSVYLPETLEWVRPVLKTGLTRQNKLQLAHPFIYVTVRHGLVSSDSDDEWHVDGFSMRVPHRPEQNYVWVSNNGTEFWDHSLHIPFGFTPLTHNINKLFQNQIAQSFSPRGPGYIDSQAVYLFDPYIIHRRPPNTQGIKRTFVRVSFVPIPIADVNNTQNEFLPTPRMWLKDGRACRESLL